MVSPSFKLLYISLASRKPAKYPLMYQAADILVINKIDTMPVFDFRKEFVEQCARKQNPEIKIFYISAKTGEGMDDFDEYLLKQIHKVNNEE